MMKNKLLIIAYFTCLAILMVVLLCQGNIWKFNDKDDKAQNENAIHTVSISIDDSNWTIIGQCLSEQKTGDIDIICSGDTENKETTGTSCFSSHVINNSFQLKGKGKIIIKSKDKCQDFELHLKIIRNNHYMDKGETGTSVVLEGYVNGKLTKRKIERTNCDKECDFNTATINKTGGRFLFCPF